MQQPRFTLNAYVCAVQQVHIPNYVYTYVFSRQYISEILHDRRFKFRRRAERVVPGSIFEPARHPGDGGPDVAGSHQRKVRIREHLPCD